MSHFASCSCLLISLVLGAPVAHSAKPKAAQNAPRSKGGASTRAQLPHTLQVGAKATSVLRPRAVRGNSTASVFRGKRLVVGAERVTADFDTSPGASMWDINVTVETANGPSRLGTAKRERGRPYEIVVDPAHEATTVATTLGSERIELSSADAVARSLIQHQNKIVGMRPRLKLSAPTTLIASLSRQTLRIIDFHVARGEANAMGIALTEGWLGADQVLRDEFLKTPTGKMLQAEGYSLAQGGDHIELEIVFHPTTKARTYSILANPRPAP